MMAACLSWRANAGFFISLSWFGLPGAAELHDLLLQDNPAGQPMPMCVSQLLCLSCRDRWWLPPRQAIRPQITPMFTAAEHHQHSATLLSIYFFPASCHVLCSLSFSFAFVMELDTLHVMPSCQILVPVVLWGEKRCLLPLQERSILKTESLFFGRNDVHFMTVFCMDRNVHCLGMRII